MKKLFVSVTIMILAIMSTALMFGCGTEVLDPAENEICLVTVIGGTGGGNYYLGDTVEVIPTVPSGKQFEHWTVGGEKVSSNDPYLFEVEGDITLTAVFIDYVDITPPAGS